MTVNIVKAMAKLLTPKKIKNLKEGFQTWMIALKSIKMDKPKKEAKTKKAPKEAKIGVGLESKLVRTIL